MHQELKTDLDNLIKAALVESEGVVPLQLPLIETLSRDALDRSVSHAYETKKEIVDRPSNCKHTNLDQKSDNQSHYPDFSVHHASVYSMESRLQEYDTRYDSSLIKCQELEEKMQRITLVNQLLKNRVHKMEKPYYSLRTAAARIHEPPSRQFSVNSEEW